MTTFTVPTAELKRQLGIVKAASSPKSSLPILAGVRIGVAHDSVAFTCTDLELTATANIPAEPAPILRPAITVAVVNVKALYGSIPAGKGSSTFTMAEGYVTIDHGPTFPTVTLPTMPLEEWPMAPDTTCDMAELDLAAFAEAIPAVGTDYARPTLCRVQLDGHRVVATDSYRLHVAERPSTEPALDGSIDGRAVRLLLKAAKGAKASSASIGMAERHSVMVIPGLRIVAATIEGEYPRYERLVPTELPHRLDLSGALATVKAIGKASGKKEPVRITVNGQVELTGARADDGCGEPTIRQAFPLGSTTDNGITIGYNPRFLADCLDGTDGMVEYTDALKPALVRSAHGIRLLMPVRIS